MNEVYLCLGGNLGDRSHFLKMAIQEISLINGLKVLEKSSVFETASWGNNQLPPFLNQVISVEYAFEPEQLMKAVLEIELKLGRTRSEDLSTFESRCIDIDLVFFGDKIIHSKSLIIPHPRLHQRKFVLIPLAELCPNFIHPELKLTINELFHLCKDTSLVTKLKIHA